MLKHEREQSAQFKKQVADLQSQAARVSELEGALQKSARWPPSRRSASLKCKNPSAGSKSWAALNAERQAATQLVQQMTTMEKAVNRSQELAQQFAREQQRVEELTRRLADQETEGPKRKKFSSSWRPSESAMQCWPAASQRRKWPLSRRPDALKKWPRVGRDRRLGFPAGSGSKRA